MLEDTVIEGEKHNSFISSKRTSYQDYGITVCAMFNVLSVSEHLSDRNCTGALTPLTAAWGPLNLKQTAGPAVRLHGQEYTTLRS